MKDKRSFIKIYADKEYIDSIRKKSKKRYGKENISKYIRDIVDDAKDSPGKKKKRAKVIVQLTEDLNQLYLSSKDIVTRNCIEEIIKGVSELWDC